MNEASETICYVAWLFILVIALDKARREIDA